MWYPCSSSYVWPFCVGAGEEGGRAIAGQTVRRRTRQAALGTRGLYFNKGIQESGVYEQICQRKNAASCAGNMWALLQLRYSRVGRSEANLLEEERGKLRWEHVGSTSIKVFKSWEIWGRFVRGRTRQAALGTRDFNKGIQELGVYGQICQKKNAASCAGNTWALLQEIFFYYYYKEYLKLKWTFSCFEGVAWGLGVGWTPEIYEQCRRFLEQQETSMRITGIHVNQKTELVYKKCRRLKASHFFYFIFRFQHLTSYLTPMSLTYHVAGDAWNQVSRCFAVSAPLSTWQRSHTGLPRLRILFQVCIYYPD